MNVGFNSARGFAATPSRFPVNLSLRVVTQPVTPNFIDRMFLSPSPRLSALMPLPALALLLGLSGLSGAAMAQNQAVPAPLSLEAVVRQTLAQNPDILLQARQVEVARGGMQQQSGRFDPVLTLSARRDRDQQPQNEYYRRYYTAQYGQLLGEVRALQTDTTALSLGLEKPLRNGMVLSSGLSVTRTEGTSHDFYGWAPQNLGRVDFSLTIPLLKGRGEAAAAGEKASTLEWQASRQAERQTIARSVLQGVHAYWRVLAAEKSLEIARANEAGMARFLDDTRRLIAADELPAADANLIEARLADRQSARIGAEQALLGARQALALALGLPYGEASARLQVSGDFPPLPLDLPTQLPAAQPLVQAALARRPDLEAARLRQEVAKVRLDAAHGELQPQLDLSLGVGYAGLSEGGQGRHYYSALGENTTGANAGLMLRYRWALGNNVARGGFSQQSALHEQASLNHYNLAREIGLNVEATLAGLLRSAQQLKASERAVAIYETSLAQERIKNRLGSATLLDVLAVDDSLRNARLAQVNDYLNYLMALASLSYESGGLIQAAPEAGATPADASRAQVDLASLVTLPALWPAAD